MSLSMQEILRDFKGGIENCWDTENQPEKVGEIMAKLKWRLFNRDRCLGVFTKAEITTITGMSANNLSTYADVGSWYKGIYRIERVNDSDFALEWETVTKKILRTEGMV